MRCNDLSGTFFDLQNNMILVNMVRGLCFTFPSLYQMITRKRKRVKRFNSMNYLIILIVRLKKVRKLEIKGTRVICKREAIPLKLTAHPDYKVVIPHNLGK